MSATAGRLRAPEGLLIRAMLAAELFFSALDEDLRAATVSMVAGHSRLLTGLRSKPPATGEAGLRS
jgi:hypothetical protein